MNHAFHVLDASEALKLQTVYVVFIIYCMALCKVENRLMHCKISAVIVIAIAYFVAL